MSEPFKPLIDGGVEPGAIVATHIIDAQGELWVVKATASVNGVTVGIAGAGEALVSAVAQCVTQLNEAKGNNLVLPITH